MTRRDWERDDLHAITLFLNGGEIPYTTDRGEPIEDDSFLLLVNAHHEDLDFRLPSHRYGTQWSLELSTAEPALQSDAWRVGPRATVKMVARSVVVLRRVEEPGEEEGS